MLLAPGSRPSRWHGKLRKNKKQTHAPKATLSSSSLGKQPGFLKGETQQGRWLGTDAQQSSPVAACLQDEAVGQDQSGCSLTSQTGRTGSSSSIICAQAATRRSLPLGATLQMTAIAVSGLHCQVVRMVPLHLPQIRNFVTERAMGHPGIRYECDRALLWMQTGLHCWCGAGSSHPCSMPVGH